MLRKRVATCVRCRLKSFELYVTLHTTVWTVRYPAYSSLNCTLSCTQQFELYVILHTTPLTMYDTRNTHGQFSDIYSLAGKTYVYRPRKRWTEQDWDGLCPVVAVNRYCTDVIGHRLTVTCTSSRACQFQSRCRKFRWLLPPRPELRNTLCARLPCCYFTFNDNYVKEVACFSSRWT